VNLFSVLFLMATWFNRLYRPWPGQKEVIFGEPMADPADALIVASPTCQVVPANKPFIENHPEGKFTCFVQSGPMSDEQTMHTPSQSQHLKKMLEDLLDNQEPWQAPLLAVPEWTDVEAPSAPSPVVSPASVMDVVTAGKSEEDQPRMTKTRYLRERGWTVWWRGKSRFVATEKGSKNRYRRWADVDARIGDPLFTALPSR
jgi:hypothetical protein